MNTMESFMLACVNVRNGALLNSRSMLTYGLAGIALYELHSAGRISFDGKNVILNTSSHTGNVFLDAALDFIAQKQTAYKTRLLVARLAYKVSRFAKRILEGLEDSGIIKIEQGRFLGLIPYNRYIVSKTSIYTRLLDELKEIVRKGERRPEPEKAMLLSVLSACNVLYRLFDKEEKKKHRNVIKLIGKTQYFETLDEFGTEVQKAVRAVIVAAQSAAT